MKLIQKCAKCHGYVHWIMPWMLNWRLVRRGKSRGRLVHRDCDGD